jgi:hypothetical protein
VSSTDSAATVIGSRMADPPLRRLRRRTVRCIGAAASTASPFRVTVLDTQSPPPSCIDATPEPPNENSLQEPKWNLLAWIWWRLGEPSPGKPEPCLTSTSLMDFGLDPDVTRRRPRSQGVAAALLTRISGARRTSRLAPFEIHPSCGTQTTPIRPGRNDRNACRRQNRLYPLHRLAV